MLDHIILPDSELAPFCEGSDLASKAHALLEQQKSSWELLRNGYESLDTVETRTFDFEGFAVKVQFNPGRLTSSSAKVDPKSIRERKCFLCPANLPAKQRGIFWEDEYLILCNPYPIFPEHFTISHRDHTPQRIVDTFDTLLDMSKSLQKRYTVFYNGPKCGASAPDHLHFQAGNKHFMPIDTEYEGVVGRMGSPIVERGSIRVYSVEGYLRRFIAFESDDAAALADAFRILYRAFSEVASGGDEPMMNILSFCDSEGWRVVIFPRGKHRPSFFFAEGDRRILLSPASVDLGGVCITPLEKDFQKITRKDIIEMFEEVSLPASPFEHLRKALRWELASTQ